jgi:hypothetical protein
MLSIPYSDMISIDVVVDALDLDAILTKPAVGSSADASMSIYSSALRHEQRVGRMRNRFWTPTEDMIADVGTKLLEDGTLPCVDRLVETMKNGRYRIVVRYRCNGHEVAPKVAEPKYIQYEEPKYISYEEPKYISYEAEDM